MQEFKKKSLEGNLILPYTQPSHYKLGMGTSVSEKPHLTEINKKYSPVCIHHSLQNVLHIDSFKKHFLSTYLPLGLLYLGKKNQRGHIQPSRSKSRLWRIHSPIQSLLQLTDGIFSPVPQLSLWPQNPYLRSNLRIKYFSPTSPVSSASSLP